MGKKRIKPRKKDGKITFDLVVREGNEPILTRENSAYDDLNEVLELLNSKIR